MIPVKKKLLFVINHLGCGGAERSLVSLLNTLDYTRYEVDLFLFKHEGVFIKYLPTQVQLLEEPASYRYFDMPVKQALLGSLRRGRLDLFQARIRFGFIFRSETNRARCEQRAWKHVAQSFEPLRKPYDAAIGFLEKNPIYYCLDKVDAKKKIGFIHNDYDQLGMDASIDLPYFEKLDHIVTVSDQCADVLKQRFPMYQHKIGVMHNIVSPHTIHELARETIETARKGTIKLITVGRLTVQKGLDLAIRACKQLVDAGYPIEWTVIGEGDDRGRLEELILHNGLEHHFQLVGLKENPYPYIKAADIYVQPSRFEGKAIAVDEAKILQKPIILTDYSTAHDHIKHGVNGLIVEMIPESIAQGIKHLIDHPAVRKLLIQQLAKESLGTESEITKFDAFVS